MGAALAISVSVAGWRRRVIGRVGAAKPRW